MAFDHSKFLIRFVEEAREHCSRMSEGLLALEKSPGDAETINALFRSAHTIKGSSRMMKLLGVTELAHRMEDVLDAVRSGKFPLTVAVSDTLFKAIDALMALLERLSSGDSSPDAPEELCEELARLGTELGNSVGGHSGGSSPVPANGTAPAEVPSQIAEKALPESSKPVLQSSNTPGAQQTGLPAAPSPQTDYLRINANKLDDLIKLMGEIVSEQGRFRKQVGRLREVQRAVTRYIESVERLVGNDESGQEKLADAGKNLQIILRQSLRSISDAALMQDHLIGDLQETSLTLRMQPLSTVFDPLRRTVRGLAREYGKDIEFIVDGGETELDRKIIERIGDPLIHMIRNALDHGLEGAEERIAAGKDPKGIITLSAFYDGGCVTIALRDDGRGLSTEKIREKALAKHIFSADVLAGMSKAEISNIIFLPGFSTSPIITDLSGRGVGMDVVRKNIVDELKGAIIIESDEGEGTTFLLRLPLNLAVFPLFLLSVSGKTCALPATSIVEMLSVDRSEIIEIVNKRAIRLREQIIPLEDLAAILRLPKETAVVKDEALVIIIRDGEEKLGLLVDEIIGREEMVVKPLPVHLQNLKIVSGATIGEGHGIINLLHVPEILRLGRELSEPGTRKHIGDEDHRLTILVVDDSINTREIEKSILEAYGYVVVTAGDGEEAYEKTRNQVFDLVITDVEMPRLDGFSLTERLRTDERYQDIPIIIVTSREKEEDKRRGITVGANAYIVKGAFDQSNLLDTVRSLAG